MLLKNYLTSASVQRTLSRKPGDEGFSLIELVVVVAVLAILAAIAIPQFSQLSDDARLNSSKSIIANMYKECEFNKARTGKGFHTAGVDNTPNGVTWGANATIGLSTKDGTGCAKLATAQIGTGTSCFVAMDLSDGTQYYALDTSAPDDTGSSNDWTSKTSWPNNLEDCT